MYIKYNHIPKSIGYLVEARIYIATHLVPLDSFTVDMSYDTSAQFIESIKVHPQLISAGFNPKVFLDREGGEIKIHCGAESGFVTDGEEVAVVKIRYRTLRADTELKINDGTLIKVHSSSCKNVTVLKPHHSSAFLSNM